MIRMLLPLGLSAITLAGTMVGCAVTGGVAAEAGTRASYGKEARLAGKALAKRDGVTAVAYAEAAVSQEPRSVAYRMLLAQSYMQAGRFDSARTAFADVLRLSPEDGKAALNLALAQIATGEWQAARETLDRYEDWIPASDFGLATALAGDPAGAVALLTAAAREPGANAKLRQNLGLALALSGQWPMARAVAAADLSPADVDARIAEWAQFAQPVHAYDQVAALLGVRPIEDKGQPVALALVAPVPTTVAVAAPAEPKPIVAEVETKPAAAAAEPSPVVAAPAPAPVKVAASPAWPVTAPPQPVLSAETIKFAAQAEVAQPLPLAEAPLLRPASTPMKIAALPIKPASSIPMKLASSPPARVAPAPHGDWVVQLGAFSDTQRAHDAWGQVTRRVAGLGDHQPQGMSVRVRNATLYRLSVSGFDRAGATALCGRVQARGAVCFVRREAGDRIAQWLRPTAYQLASR